MDAEDWLMDTERKLKTVGCNDEEKIRYTTYLLSGPAASWWENLVAVHPPDKVFTWEEFKKKFRDAHVPESVVELKKREFDELRQNTAPIMQYVRDFNRLSRYAPEDVDTEEKRKKRFMKGMNPYMKMQLRLARTAEFQELIDSAITFEDDYRQVQEDRRKRARIEPRKYPISKPTPNRSFKPRFRPTTGSQYNRGGKKSQESQPASAGRRTPERKELSGAEIRLGKFPPEGEIDAIVTVIELDIISITIIIISIIITAVSTAAHRHRCNNLGSILIV
ncbi:hypothetical protein QYE76_033782 [Lolium multiflorum]|uniref:Retrotransposon gag domain-containing protein n=1 Tax=Lolium multiflorum TaxID=4521 RepID=A0AAD8QZC1_LOLMU|nr:hypothetical protein QYE76_033782 [Lolium multiflorum]